MKKLLKISALVLTATLFTACGTGPVYNVQQHPVKAQASSDVVFTAIKEAGLSLGWKITKLNPGVAEGKLYLRTHVAIVKITYTNNNYSINYVDSQNLKYDAESNEIHTNYNGWIQNLEKAIDIRL